ncbi:Proteasome subunit beta type-4 [Conglomerata obtusa]
MDSLIAIKTDNFVLIASDTNASSSILLHKTSHSKIHTIGNTIFAYSGPQGNAFRLCNFSTESAILAGLKYQLPVTPTLLKNIIQKNVYESLRSQSPVQVGCLIGGTENKKTKLYMVDQYGASNEDDYFCMGYCAYFGLGVLDMEYKNDLAEDEAIEIVRNIGNTMKKRLVVSYDKFRVSIVNENGVRETEVIF